MVVTLLLGTVRCAQRARVLWGCRLVFGAGRKVGILPPEKDAIPRTDFVGFGLVLGSDGKRIRTRDEGAVSRGWEPAG